METSRFKCPSCQTPLTRYNDGDKVVLYCGHGSCKSDAMNTGASAATEELAMAELEKIAEKEPSE